MSRTDIATTLFAALAAVATVWAAYEAMESAEAARRQLQVSVEDSATGTVRASLSEYLSSYQALLAHKGGERALETKAGYKAARVEVRSLANLTAARLLAVIEAMDVAHDPRAPTWEGYLAVCKGPLSVPAILPAYASTAHGRAIVAHAGMTAAR